MSFVLRRRPRIAQPNPGDRLDWSDPLLDGLVFAFDGGTWIDHVTGRYAAASGGPSLISTDEGLATYFNGSSYLDFGDDDRWDVTGPLTIFWRGSFDAVAGAFRCIVSKTASGGTDNTPFDWYINSATGSPRIFRANGSSYSAQDLNTVPSAGVIQTLLFADDGDPSTAGSGFVERASGVTSIASGATSVTGTSSPLRLGQRSDGATALTGWINCLYIWARRLSDDEYFALYEAPRRTFARQRIWVPVSAGGGAIDLTSAGASTATTLGAAAATQAHALAGAGVSSVTTLTGGALSQTHAPAADAVASATTVTTGSIGVSGAIAADAPTTATALGTGAAAQLHVVTLSSEASATALGTGAATQRHAAGADNEASATTLTDGAMAQVHALVAAAVASASSLAGGAITQTHAGLAASDAAQPTNLTEPNAFPGEAVGLASKRILQPGILLTR